MDILHECKYSAVFAHFTITIVFCGTDTPSIAPSRGRDLDPFPTRGFRPI